MATVVLDFNDIASTQQIYTEYGFSVTAALGSHGPYFWGTTVVGIPHTAAVDFENQILTFTDDAGMAFDASSVLLEGRTGPGGDYTFTGIKADGTQVTQTFHLDGVIGFQSFSFDASFSDLVALKTDDASFAWIDNLALNVHPNSPPTAVADTAAVNE